MFVARSGPARFGILLALLLLAGGWPGHAIARPGLASRSPAAVPPAVATRGGAPLFPAPKAATGTAPPQPAPDSPPYILADLGGGCPAGYPVGVTRSPFGGAPHLISGGAGAEPALRCYATADDAQAGLPTVPPPPSGGAGERGLLYRDTLQYPNSGPAGIGSGAGRPGTWSVYWDWSELVLRSDAPDTAGWLLLLASGAPADAALAVDGHLVAGLGSGTLTLACRWSAGQGYLLAFDPATSAVTLLRADGPDVPVTVLADGVAALPRPLENWPATIDLACAGDMLSAAVNGQTVTSATDATYGAGDWAFGVSPLAGATARPAAKFHNLVLAEP